MPRGSAVRGPRLVDVGLGLGLGGLRGDGVCLARQHCRLPLRRVWREHACKKFT
jgi:hypothetical protein